MIEVADDFYLPAQVPSSHKNQPERKLWLAVLNRARMDYAGQAYLGRDREAERAADWFGSEGIEPGSFVWLCTVLGIQPDAVRASLPQEKIRASRLRYRVEWRI